MQRIFFVFILLVISYFYFFNEPQKMHKIGVLSHAKVADVSLKGFKEGLKIYGYIENKNIQYYYDGATGKVSDLPAASQKILEKNVDLILTLTTPAGLQAQKDTLENKTPIVFAPASNPVGSGLVQSINNPGSNITGVTFGLQEVKRLEWLLKILPDTKKIYYPYNSKDKSPVVTLNELQKFVKNSDVKIVTQDLKTKEDIIHSLNNLPKDIDVVFIPTDALVASNLKKYLKVCNKLKIPISVPHRMGVELGAFMSYGFSLYELGLQSSRIAKEILNGGNPKNIPVETSEFKLSINTKNMKELGINVPDNILIQAVKIN